MVEVGMVCFVVGTLIALFGITVAPYDWEDAYLFAFFVFFAVLLLCGRL